MKRFFSVMLLFVCLLAFGACTGVDPETDLFFEKYQSEYNTYYNDYLVKFFTEYLSGCEAFSDFFGNVPVLGTLLDAIATIFAYTAGGILLIFRIILSFFLYFGSQTSFLSEDVVKNIMGTILKLIS